MRIEAAIALCMSGQPRIFSSYVSSHRLTLDAVRSQYPTTGLFLSMHVDGISKKISDQLQRDVQSLKPTSYEFWSSGGSTCRPRCLDNHQRTNWTVGTTHMRCSFFWQYTSVKRVWLLLRSYEEQRGRSQPIYGYVLRLRLDAVCPSDQLLAMLADERLVGSRVNASSWSSDPFVDERFRGMTRTGHGPDVAKQRWSDMALAFTRAVAESVMTVVDEWSVGCGTLLNPATLQSMCSEPLEFMYYECIINARLLARHPRVQIIPTLPRRWVCRKLCGEGVCVDRES